MKNRIAVFAAVIALPLGMVACSSDDNAAADVPSEVQSVVDEYVGSWNAYDGEAFLEVVTDDYVFVNTIRDQRFDAEAQARIVDTMLEASGWAANNVDLMVAADENGPFYVGVSQTLVLSTRPEGVEGISTLTLVEDDGELKVSEHIYVGQLP